MEYFISNIHTLILIYTKICSVKIINTKPTYKTDQIYSNDDIIDAMMMMLKYINIFIELVNRFSALHTYRQTFASMLYNNYYVYVLQNDLVRFRLNYMI